MKFFIGKSFETDNISKSFQQDRFQPNSQEFESMILCKNQKEKEISQLKSDFIYLENEFLNIKKLNEDRLLKFRQTDAESKEKLERLISINNSLQTQLCESKRENFSLKDSIETINKDYRKFQQNTQDLEALNLIKYQNEKQISSLESKLFVSENECSNIKKLNEDRLLKFRQTDAESKEKLERLISINNSLNAKIQRAEIEILNIVSVNDCLVKDLDMCSKENVFLKSHLNNQETQICE